MSIKQIFGYLIVLPQGIFWILIPLAEKVFKGFYSNDYPVAGYILLTISLVGGVILIYKNYSSKIHSIGWYSIAILTILFNGGLMYVGSSLSNFGF